MPKTKSSKSSRAAYHDSDEEAGPSQVPATQSLTQVEKQLAQLSPADQERKVNDLVQYLLIQDQRKVPIKKQDISKNVLKEHSRAFPFFIQQAEEKLSEIFGISLTEIDGKQKSYILVSQIDNDTDHPHQTWSEDDNAKMGLVMVVLATIFMNGGVIQDSKLYHMLKKLGVDIDQPHEVFGDVKKVLTQDMVRQAYFEYTRQATSDPPTYEYTWGARAGHETTRRNVLDFVCQVYDKEPEYWVSQYREVLRAEGCLGETDREREVQAQE